MTVAYVESSALVKVVLEERGSDELRTEVTRHDRTVSSGLTTLEVGRAARRARGEVGLARARAAILPLVLLPVDRPILDAALKLRPPHLRSLDAIHVATALAVDDPDLVFLSYDQRTVEAAITAGLDVRSPGENEVRA